MNKGWIWPWFRVSTEWKKQKTIEEVNKINQLREELKWVVRQTQVDKVIDQENKEKQFEPIIQRVDKV